MLRHLLFKSIGLLFRCSELELRAGRVRSRLVQSVELLLLLKSLAAGHGTTPKAIGLLLDALESLWRQTAHGTSFLTIFQLLNRTALWAKQQTILLQ